MRGTPAYRGSKSSVTFEGIHSVTSSFSIADSNHNKLFMIHLTGATSSVNYSNFSNDVCNYLTNGKSDVQDQFDTCL